MSQKPQRGDRSRRDDDRYLFLEALMSAEQTLYISYIGRSIQDNSERFPSVLVQELVDYIGQSHCLAGDEELDCDASEARVKAHITHLHTRMPFDVANFQDNENKSYAREWLAAAGQQGEAHSDFIQPLTAPPIDSLPFEQLLRFWQHPVRAFFQQRLRVNFRAEEDDIPDDEPFTLEGLSRYQLNQQLLNTLIEEQDVSAMFRRFRAAGELPYGAFGELVWETQRLEMQALAERVMAERQQAQSMEIDLQCGGVNLTGWLQQVQPDGLLRWRPSLLSVSQGCNFGWNTLSTVPAAVPARAGCLCVKRRVAFSAAGAAEAQAYLNELVDGYLLGMSQPLLLLPESGGAWLKACYDAEKDVILMDEETQQKARSKFLQTYEGNMVVSGEGPISGINACGVRWSRRITKKSLPRRSVICYRYIVTISPHKFK
jgi:exodeoxyribonuclease V gamma subunit